MKLVFEEICGIGCILLSGRIDASNYKEFEIFYTNHFKINKKILIDLTDVSFMDSTGLGSLVSCLKYSKENSGILKLSGVENKVKVVFSITKANKIFEIFQDKKSGIDSYN